MSRSTETRNRHLPDPLAAGGATRRGATGLAVRGLLTLTLLLLPWPLRGQDDVERMERFLARLGLVDLQIAHLEQTLQESRSPDRQQQLATRLADLYAELLMTHVDDKPRYEQTLQRITKLLQAYPHANTTALQVMLLQADYNRAETLIASWISDPQQTAAREEAERILARITPELVTHQAELNQKAEALNTALSEMPDGDLYRTQEAEVRRQQAVAARATYFAAWSNYYLGLATNAAANAPPFQQARAIFLQLLGFEDALPEDLEAEWLGLESIWRARALIGLGLSLAACGDVAGSERCFAALEEAAAPPEVKDQAPYWRVRALLSSGQLERATAYAQQTINAYQPPATQGQVSLCAALVREGFAGEVTPQRRALGNLGLLGLARLGELGAITTLLKKYAIEPDAAAGFVLLWAAGQEQFAAAEKSRAATDYEKAVDSLTKALRAPEAASLAGPAARCRYTLGWAHFRLDRLEEAAREFSEAFVGLRESNDALAVETAWMAFAAFRQLAESQPRFLPLASDAQKRLAQHFPDHAYTQRAEYEMGKLMERSDPETMLAQLEATPADDPNYALARYDLCLLLHRLWSDEKTSAQGAQRVEALRQAADTYLDKVPGAEPSRQLQVCLLAADAALHHSPPNMAAAAAMLSRAARPASQLPDTHPHVAQYHYRQLELATAQNDAAQQQLHANWLAEHAAGSPYEEAALVVVAKGLEAQLKAAQTGEQDTLHRQAQSVYRRLVDAWGAGPEKLASSKNAQVAASRLAHFCLQVGQPDEAARLLEQLLQIHPRDKRYLERAAQAHAAAGQYAQALPHWRTLLAGLPSGSEAWYEAKYHQLEALARTDKEQARKVYQQLQLLHPELGGSTWRAKFTELAGSW